MDAQGVAGGRLLSLIQRIENLEAEKAEVAESIKEVYAEGKSAGFDTKIMRAVIRLRKMDAQERAEQEQLIQVYEAALGALKDTPLGESAISRGTKALAEKAKVLVRDMGKAAPKPKRIDAASPPDLPGAAGGIVGTGVPEPHDPETGELPPKSVAGSVSALRAAMNSPAR